MKIVKSGSRSTIYNDIEITDALEPKNYILKYDMFGIFLQETQNFVLPDKLYDVEKEFRNIVLKSHFKTNRNTGVILEGYKGQGKTITAKLLAIESKLPIIIIDQQIPISVNFISFLNSIEQEYCLFIDEFEKIFKPSSALYDDNNEDQLPSKGFHNQDCFLTIMDGVLSNKFKKLFVFTSNSKVGDKFMNRPSRVKWHKVYNFMDSKLFDMIVEDKLQYKEFTEDLLRNLPLKECTVDLLTTIIDQINILEIPYSEFKKFFNHHADSIKYNLEYKLADGKGFIPYGEINLSSEPVLGSKYIFSIAVKSIEEINDNGVLFSSLNILPGKDYQTIFNKIKELSDKQIIYKLTKANSFVEKFVM